MKRKTLTTTSATMRKQFEMKKMAGNLFAMAKQYIIEVEILKCGRHPS
jgi:hypothetical protein